MTRAYAALMGMAFLVAACGGESAPPPPTILIEATETAPTVETAAMTTTPSGLMWRDLEVGTGAEATSGQTATVHYVGWLLDGEKFDASLDRGETYSFPVGGRRVIAGWDEGVAGMKVGGVRRLVIPPELGYGEGGSPPVIPPNATLVFDVQLMGVGG